MIAVRDFARLADIGASSDIMDTSRRSTAVSLGSWIEGNYRPVLWGLVVIAAITRATLAIHSAKPYGYVWDFYHEGVILTYERARIPSPADCWECYQPPLFFAAGVPLYALGLSLSGGDAAAGLRVLSLLSLICACFVIYFCHRTLRLLRPSRGALLLGTALALVFPCLFISSYGAENDMLLAALMSAFLYKLCLYHLRPASSSWREPLLMGILAGLSALTKYPGLLTVITAVIILTPRLLFGRRLRTARDLAVIILVTGVICGGHYARNMRMTGKPFLGPPGYPETVADIGKVRRNWERYDFRAFKIREVVDLYRPGNAGTLNDFKVYTSVWSTLHALAWTDMSFFSVPSRHGWKLPPNYAEGGGRTQLVAETPATQTRVAPYPEKTVRLWLIGLILRLGVLPSLLAIVGFTATLHRRALRPFVVFSGVSLSAYIWWFLAQPAWALKTKYILFLLPAYVAYSVIGLRALNRVNRRLGNVAIFGMISTLLVSEAYLLMFALG